MNATEAQRAKVEEAAGMVLAARAQYPASTLADLYDPVTMPPALAKAHEASHRSGHDTAKFLSGNRNRPKQLE